MCAVLAQDPDAATGWTSHSAAAVAGGAAMSAPDLFTQVDAETWLLERLKVGGHDPYAGGPYASLAERLGACIVRNGIACVIAGRGPDRRPETYQACFERLFQQPLVPKAARAQSKTR